MRDSDDPYFMVVPEFNDIFTPELQSDNIVWSLSKQPTPDEEDYFSVLVNWIIKILLHNFTSLLGKLNQ